MKKILLAVLAVCMGILVYAEAPQQISFAAEEHLLKNTQDQSYSISREYETTEEGSHSSITTLQFKELLGEESNKKMANDYLNICQKSNKCRMEYCGQNDILVEDVIIASNQVADLTLHRFTVWGKITYHKSFELGENLKAPLSTYRRAFCQLNVF